MSISPRTASLVLVTTVIAAACGGNVVVDGQGSGGGTSTVGAGGAPGSSSFMAVGVGAGAATSVSSGGGFAVAASSSSAGGGSGGAGGTGGTPGETDACTQGGIPAAFDSPDLPQILADCAVKNLGNSGGLEMCIEAQTGLMGGCLVCVNDFVQCAEEHCEGECIPPQDSSPPCIACEATFCTPTFFTCSGLGVALGSLTCAAVLGGGPTVMTWNTTLLPSDFATVAGSQAYGDFDTCVCTTVTASGGCADLCNEQFDGTNVPNYCNGAVALSQCANCVEQRCGSELMTCEAS